MNLLKEYIRQVLQEITTISPHLLEDIEKGLLKSKFWEWPATTEYWSKTTKMNYQIERVLRENLKPQGIYVFVLNAGSGTDDVPKLQSASWDPINKDLKIHITPSWKEGVVSFDYQKLIRDILGVIRHELTHVVQLNVQGRHTELPTTYPSYGTASYWKSKLESEAYASQLAYSLVKAYGAQASEILKKAFQDNELIPAGFEFYNWGIFRSLLYNKDPELKASAKRFLKKTYQYIQQAEEQGDWS